MKDGKPLTMAENVPDVTKNEISEDGRLYFKNDVFANGDMDQKPKKQKYCHYRINSA